MYVFGCDDNGVINYPETATECIQSVEKAGFVFESKIHAVSYINGEWYFTIEPEISAYPVEFVEQLLVEFANPCKQITYFAEVRKTK